MKQVSVYNTLGQCALQKNVEESQISLDLQGLSSGLFCFALGQRKERCQGGLRLSDNRLVNFSRYSR